MRLSPPCTRHPTTAGPFQQRRHVRARPPAADAGRWGGAAPALQPAAPTLGRTTGAAPPQRRQRHKPCAMAEDSRSAAAAAGGAQQLPLLVGLTGSIGMGKSTVAGLLTSLQVAVLSADEVVHQLYAPGGAAVGPVGAAFPSAVAVGAPGGAAGGGAAGPAPASSSGQGGAAGQRYVDRGRLSAAVVGNEAAMKQLEAIVHPLVEQARVAFVQQHAASGARLVVFDVPLLYETHAEQQCDVVLVVSASAEQQRQRVLARPGMTVEKLAAMLARQVPDEEKRRRADYVIDTGCSLQDTRAQVAGIVQELLAKQHNGSAARRLLQQQQQQ